MNKMIVGNCNYLTYKTEKPNLIQDLKESTALIRYESKLNRFLWTRYQQRMVP